MPGELTTLRSGILLASGVFPLERFASLPPFSIALDMCSASFELKADMCELESR